MPSAILAPDPEAIAATAFRRFSSLKEAALERAEAAVAHRFDLLGSGPVDLGPKIDWHVDFKTGRRWDPARIYRQYKDYVDPALGGDVIVPWELSRFQHATGLGLAWLLTKDQRYTREFETQVEEWLESNPYPLGVNWACTMDVAIRAVNWLWGAELMAGGLNRAFSRGLREALFLHAEHIHQNPEEWSGIRNNHYVADMSGLTILGALFRRTEEGKLWLATGVGALEAEVARQTYADGTNYEGSINYHRLSAELFLLPAVVLRRIGVAVSDTFRERLAGMARFVAAYTRPDGSWPQVGDTDDGRLQIFHPHSMTDHRYLISAIACFLEDPAIKALHPAVEPETLLMLAEFASIFDGLPQAVRTCATAFPDGGYYVMGDPRQGDWALVRCGPVGIPGSGGHAHCDALAIELAVAGRPLLVDRGTGVYTPAPAVRNNYRSTHMHNTIRVDGEEQNPFDPAHLWQMPDAVRSRCMSANIERFDGRHEGYSRLDTPVFHRRTVTYSPASRSWEVRDRIEGTGSHRVEAFWHFDPQRQVHLSGRQVITDIARVELSGPPGLEVNLLPGRHSRSYGQQCPAQHVKCTVTAELPLTLRARVLPSAAAASSHG